MLLLAEDWTYLLFYANLIWLHLRVLLRSSEVVWSLLELELASALTTLRLRCASSILLGSSRGYGYGSLCLLETIHDIESFCSG